METTDPLSSAAQLSEYALDIIARSLDFPDEQGWVRWAWGELVCSGAVAPAADEYAFDYPDHVLTLAALGHLYELFRNVYAGCSPDVEPNMDSLLGDEPPDLTVIALARYCERKGYVDSNYPESECGLLSASITARTFEVCDLLRKSVGTPRLFASLAATAETLQPYVANSEDAEEGPWEPVNGIEYPNLDQMYWLLNMDLTPDRLYTYEWLERFPG